jgi:hypothetical protein
VRELLIASPDLFIPNRSTHRISISQFGLPLKYPVLTPVA